MQLGCTVARQARQIDVKSTTFAEFAFDPDAATVELDDLAGDEQAEAGAADGTRGGVVDAVELLEKMRHVGGRDARPRIFDVTLRDFVIAGEADGDFALGSVLDGIIEQIGDDFAQAVGIYVDIIKRSNGFFTAGVLAGVDGVAGADHELHGEAFLFGRESEVGGQFLEETAEFDNGGMAGQAAVFGFGAGQEVLEELAEVLRGIVGFLEVVAGAVIDGGDLVVECQCQIAFDRGHRRAHLMAGGADEVGSLLLLGLLLADIAENGDRRGYFLPVHQRCHAKADGELLVFAVYQEGVVVPERLVLLEDTVEGVFVLGQCLAFVIDEFHDVLDIQSGGLADVPAENGCCRRVDQLDDLLAVDHDHAVSDVIDDDFEALALVVEVAANIVAGFIG